MDLKKASMTQLKFLLASGLEGTEYKKVFAEYMKRKFGE